MSIETATLGVLDHRFGSLISGSWQISGIRYFMICSKRVPPFKAGSSGCLQTMIKPPTGLCVCMAEMSQASGQSALSEGLQKDAKAIR